jgi:single-strand DNA-binding protein
MAIIKGNFGVLAAGRLGQDAETRYVGQKQTKMVTFSICAHSPQDAPAVWINVVAFSDAAEAAQNFRKGDSVLVVGKKQTRQYEGKDGTPKTSDELVADFVMPQWRVNMNVGAYNTQHNNGYVSPQAPPNAPDVVFKELNDDELPF